MYRRLHIHDRAGQADSFGFLSAPKLQPKVSPSGERRLRPDPTSVIGPRENTKTTAAYNPSLAGLHPCCPARRGGGPLWQEKPQPSPCLSEGIWPQATGTSLQSTTDSGPPGDGSAPRRAAHLVTTQHHGERPT
ncbi:unnamed protein product, partial [Gadus morhua 'NCC']